MLKEIRNQPEHIRVLFMWLSVFIVFSLIVFIWFQGFEQKITALLEKPQEAGVANQESPLSVMARSFGDLKALILDLFGLAVGFKKEAEIKSNLENRFGTKIEPRLLPVSEDKSND